MFKVSATFSFFVLLFLYNFCSILCFAIEDNLSASELQLPLLGEEYWYCLSTMLVSTFVLLGYLFCKPREPKGGRIASFLFFMLILFLTFFAARVFQAYFNGDAEKDCLWMIAISILSFVLYLLFTCLETRRINRSNGKIYLMLMIALFAACDVMGYFLSLKYMPPDVIRTIKQDTGTLSNLDIAISEYAAGRKMEKMLEGIEYRDVSENKRIFSWNMKTDFSKVTSRMKRQYKYRNVLQGKKYKTGLNEKEVSRKEK
ncbi:MAG: hypothetical protein IJT08_04155 [Alphaproteobacteria bacterium]|nr:hypothetical protein [Alphaproteobacteria bacterium]